MTSATETAFITFAPGDTILEGADAPADNTTPYEIEPGEIFQGQIDPGSDIDWIEIELEAPYDYIFRLTSENLDPSTGSISLSLWNEAFITSRAGDTANDGDTAAFLYDTNFTFGQAGIHYLEVESFQNASSFDYELTVEQDIGQSEESTATLTIGQTESDGIDFTNDRDWYGIDVLEGFTYAFIATITDEYNAYQTLNLDLRYDSIQSIGGDTGYIDDDGNRLTILDFNPTEDRSYHLEVEDSTTGTTIQYFGGYDVTVIREVLDTIDTQEVMTVGQVYNGSYDYFSDSDWIGVDLVAGTEYRISFQTGGVLGQSWGRLTLRNDAGSFVAESGNIQQLSDGELIYTPTESGRFFLQLTASSSDFVGDYILHVDETETLTEQSEDADEVFGTANADAIAGLGGNDTLYGGDNSDTLEGGDGADLLGGGVGNDRLLGGAGADAVFTAAGDDTGFGGAGDDTVGGAAGNDLLSGGDGDDEVWGATGNDTLDGGEGNDTLGGSVGDDNLDGGAGDDELWGAVGNDTLDGWDGNDTLGGADGNDLLHGGNNNDELWGASGQDTLDGGSGDDSVGAGADDDRASGGSGNDQVFGGLGNDTVLGGSGNDTLYGAAGNDSVDGGLGNDQIFLGAGEDVLVFSGGTDTTEFFSVADDQIDLADSQAVAFQTNGFSVITDYADLIANHLSDVNGNAVIDDLNGNTLTLDGISAASLTEDNFIF